MNDGFNTLQLKGMTVERGGKRLLGPLDFTLKSGGITAVLGHNGAGKSLFIMACHGQFAATEGEVLWNGLPATQTRRCRSLMFQNTPLLRRSVFANIEFPLLAHGTPRAARRDRVTEALEIARLTHRATTPAASLSGGEKQRMALARAWVTRPQVILLDEPSASLDPASTKALEESVQNVAALGVKVLIATHDLMQARRLANDVLVFGAGALLAHEPAEDFFNRPHDGPVGDFLEGRL